jgi:hypothetical protein
MQKNKPRVPNPHQQYRQAILGQITAPTEDLTGLGSDTANTGAKARGISEDVGPLNREMYSSPPSSIPWDKLGVFLAAAIALIGFIWYLASQDSAVKNLTDDTKDLKKRTDETVRSTIESSVRLNNVEQRLTVVEQHDRNGDRSRAAAPQTIPEKNGKKTFTQ